MSYHIRDEPRPGALSGVAVNPLWPLLAVMLGGTWLSWPWFALNGFAVGSPSRSRELGLAIGGFAGSYAIIIGVFVLNSMGVVEGVGVRYALLVLTVWKIAVSYVLFMLQGRSFHLYEYYGGKVRNGILVVFVALFVGRKTVLDAVGGSLLLTLLLS